jgi:two-component system osmolarity sensor histidine kinase EnvZ
MHALSRWFNTLFARLLVMQLVVIVLIVALIAGWGVRKQGQEMARLEAPSWAAALKASGAQPGDFGVIKTVSLVPGPPPWDALFAAFLWRYRDMPEELRRLGIPVSGIMISGRDADAIAWLKIAQQDGGTRWVGVRSALGGQDARERIGLATAGALAVMLAVIWWLSRWVLQPVAKLRQAMRHFEVDGVVPERSADSAPVEIRELAQQFTELARQRVEADELRRTMLAGISHDLRSPLARIRMAAELLPPAEGVAERRAVIASNVFLADRLLGSFIDYARAEDQPVSDAVDLCALLSDIVRSEHDLTVGELPAKPQWLMPASAVALERALRNLLDNARSHGAAPICLSLHTESHQSVLSVRDHGPGIAPDAQQAMLQPFVRGDTSRHAPGTGLGLAIVRRTAARHGGSVVLANAGPGLRVELRLPPCRDMRPAT